MAAKGTALAEKTEAIAVEAEAMLLAAETGASSLSFLHAFAEVLPPRLTHVQLTMASQSSIVAMRCI